MAGRARGQRRPSPVAEGCRAADHPARRALAATDRGDRRAPGQTLPADGLLGRHVGRVSARRLVATQTQTQLRPSRPTPGNQKLRRRPDGYQVPLVTLWAAVLSSSGGAMTALIDAAGRRRSPATMPGYHVGRPPRNKGLRYPADPPTVEEIVVVMRQAGTTTQGLRTRALIVICWRAGLRIGEALALTEAFSTSGAA